MANTDFAQKAINLDTFTSEIPIPMVKVFSIEWVNPTEVGHKCVVKIDSGAKIVDWTCHDADRGEIKYFDSIAMNLVIEQGAVDSGELIIIQR
jgi:hypothetical protein